MTDERQRVVAGVDAHRDAHQVAVLDSRGRLLATAGFPATARGYEALVDWIESHGQIELVGVESTGSFAAGLVRVLAARAIAVVEVNQPHPHRHRRGKSDPVDAELAARAALSGTAAAVPKYSGGVVEAIRQLAVTRAGAVKARSAALHQLDDLVVTAPDALRRSALDKRKTLRGKATLCLKLRPDSSRLHEPLQASKLALRSLARRIRDLDAEIDELDNRLRPLVATAAPQTTALLGVGTQHAAQLLVTAGQNIDRIKSEAAFARICAAAPIPASSGRTTRYRLDPAGDRQANHALHLIAVCRLRYCPRTRAYAQRRTHDGLSKRDVIRSLKRYIAREIYRTLRTDLAAHSTP